MTTHEPDADDDRVERTTATARPDAHLLADGGSEPAARTVEAVAVGVCVADEAGQVVQANQACAELLGTESDDLVGQSVHDAIPGIDAAAVDDVLAAGGTDEELAVEATHERRAGSTVTLEVRARATGNEDDDAPGLVLTLVDVTERVESEREVRRQDERLEEFASVVSHDLRNPLNVAMGRVQLVAEEVESDHLEPVDDALLHMEELITDVLALARQGSSPHETEPLGLGPAARKAWARVEVPDASLEIVDDLGAVRSTEDRLDAIFRQLFENSIQHGGDEPTIEVGRTDDGFYVADDGPGIPEDERAEVFEYGYTTASGTGLGLPIVKDVAAAHRWSVSLAETDDGGVRVEISDVDVE